MKMPRNGKLYAIIGIVVVLLAGQYLLANFSKTAVESNAVTKVATEQEFKGILDRAGSKLVVVDLYADWCGPCRMIQPTIAKLAEKYSGKVDFCRVDVDENPKVAAAFGTQAIPYVVFIKDGTIITAFAGAKTSGAYEKIIAENTDTAPNDNQKQAL